MKTESSGQASPHVVAPKLLQTRIRNLVKDIRLASTKRDTNSIEAKGSEVWEAHLNGTEVKRLVIYLKTRGCSWVLPNKPSTCSTGCFDCEHGYEGTTKGIAVSAEDIIEQYLKEIQKYDPMDFPIICVYNEGNFLCDKEMPLKAQDFILNHLRAKTGVQKVIIESLPYYINRDNIDRITGLLGNIELEIGIGLDAYSADVRSLCVNKPFTIQAFEETVKTLNSRCKILAYVLLKPSFLTEKEGICEAIQSIKYAFSIGIDAVSLEPVGISTNSLSGWLAGRGLKRVPWIWSAIEVIQETASIGEVRFGGFQFSPAYEQTMFNCPKCTDSFKKAISLYNKTYNPSYLLDKTCECKKKWEEETRITTPSLKTRIISILSKYGY